MGALRMTPHDMLQQRVHQRHIPVGDMDRAPAPVQEPSGAASGSSPHLHAAAPACHSSLPDNCTPWCPTCPSRSRCGHAAELGKHGEAGTAAVAAAVTQPVASSSKGDDVASQLEGPSGANVFSTSSSSCHLNDPSWWQLLCEAWSWRSTEQYEMWTETNVSGSMRPHSRTRLSTSPKFSTSCHPKTVGCGAMNASKHGQSRVWLKS